MIVNSLKINKFRNYKQNTNILFNKGVNVFVGKNGAGKSDLLLLINVMQAQDLRYLEVFSLLDIELNYTKFIEKNTFDSHELSLLNDKSLEFSVRVTKEVVEVNESVSSEDTTEKDKVGREAITSVRNAMNLEVGSKKRFKMSYEMSIFDDNKKVAYLKILNDSVLFSLFDDKVSQYKQYCENLSTIPMTSRFFLSLLKNYMGDSKDFDTKKKGRAKPGYISLARELPELFFDLSRRYTHLYKIQSLYPSDLIIVQDGKYAYHGDCTFSYAVSDSSSDGSAYGLKLIPKIDIPKKGLNQYLEEIIIFCNLVNKSNFPDTKKISEYIKKTKFFSLFFNLTRFSDIEIVGTSNAVTVKGELTEEEKESYFWPIDNIISSSFLFKLKDKNGVVHSVESMTPGEKRFFGLCIMMEKNIFSPNLFIDELENGFHPLWITEVLKTSSNHQLFITTHNPYVLDKSYMLIEDDEYELHKNIHIVESEKGTVTIKSLRDFDKLPVLNKWLNEFFGSVSEFLIDKGIW